MGDIRYERTLESLERASDRAAAIRALPDEEIIAALAAAGAQQADPYLVNVLASEAMNRVRRSSTILDTTTEGIYAVDARGRLVHMNRAAEALLGWREAELRGRAMHDTIHHTHADGTPRPADTCALLGVLHEGEPARSDDDVFVRKDGSLLPVAYTSSPLVREGEPEGAVVVFRDITSRKRLERLRSTRHHVMDIIATSRTAADAGPRLLEAMGQGFGWDTGALWVVDRESDTLRCAAFWSAPGLDLPRFEEVCRESSFTAGTGIPGIVFESGEPYWVEDFSKLDPARFPRVAAAAQDGLRAAFAFPCPVGRRPVAVLDFFSREVKTPDADALEMVDTLGGDVGEFLHRKEAEARLQVSEARKRGILESALDAIVTIDHEGRILEFNKAAEQTFGWSASEVIGRDLYGVIVPPRFRAAHRAGMARYLASGESRILGRLLELPAVRRDGTEIPMEVYIVRVPTEGPPVFTSHLRDIRERTQAERALREAESRYRNLFLAMPDPIVLADVERGVIDCNPAFTELTGYTRDEVVGRTTRLFYASDEAYEEVGRALRSHDAGGPFKRETTWVRRSGETLPVEVHGALVRDDEGRVSGYIGTVRDLTLRRRIIAELEESRERHRRLYEELPTMAFRIRADGTILHANTRAVETLGYRRDELEGRRLADIVPPSDHATLDEQLRVALERPGHVVRRELRKLRKDGRVLWVVDEARAEASEDAQQHVLLACEDVTALRQVQTITDAALPQRPLAQMLDDVARCIALSLGVDTVAVLTAEPERDALRVRASVGLEEEARQGLTLRLGEGFAGRVARERRPVLVDDPRPEDIASPALRARGLRTLCGVPLLVGERLVGILHVGSTRPRAFTQDDVHLLQMAADRIAIAIDHARLDEALRESRREAQARIEELEARLRER